MSEQQPTVTTMRKDRRDGVTGEIKRGPTHQWHSDNQSWCGRKIKGFARWIRDDDPANVDCVACQRAVAANQPRAWRG